MKKLLFLLMTATTMALFPLSAFAQNNGDDEYEAIDLTFEQNNPDIGARTGNLLPIEAYYSSGLSAVFVNFLNSVGEVEIRLTNLTTGGMVSTVVNSAIGSCWIPVTGGSGVYRISFNTEEGFCFYGLFSI